MKSLRLLSTGLGTLLSVAAFAGPGMLETKTDTAPSFAATNSSPLGIMPMIQMLVALAIVGGLVKWAMPKALGKVSKLGKSGEIVVEASQALGAGTVHVISVRGRTLLVGATANNMSLLAELSEHDATFDESFARTVFETPTETAPTAPSDDVAAALARLSRLEER